MYHEIATYVDEDFPAAGPYTGDDLILANKFKSAVNTAYLKIAKEVYRMEYKEDVVLDSNSQFAISSLTKTFYQAKKIENTNEYPVDWEFVPEEKIECINESSGNTVTVFYYYLPAELTDTDTPVFPAGVLDHKVLCYFAAFAYWNMEVDDSAPAKAAKWLALWNDGYLNIKPARGAKMRIRRVC